MVPLPGISQDLRMTQIDDSTARNGMVIA